VPRISNFYGITIRMFFDEDRHPGRPHFHAEYGGRWASFAIDDMELLAGGLSPRALRLVTEWARAHDRELVANWNRMRRHGNPFAVPPLK
jgi:Domain of unknown function (DUF4160)